MTTLCLRALTLVLAAAGLADAAPPCSAHAASAGDVPVGWRQKEYSTARLPPDLPPAALDAITRWHGWARDTGYRMDLDGQGRMVLLTPASSSRARELLRVLGKAQAWFDGVLPAPERAQPAPGPSSAPGGAPAAPTPPPLPEDPEGPPPGAGVGTSGRTAPAQPATGAAPQRAWGSGSIEPDTQAAVLVVLKDMDDHARLLDQLERSARYLKDWIPEARKQTGLTLEDPLLGAYVENAPGQEEWNGDHELVNRAVQLLTLRRFGQLPNWVVQGIAWEAEMAFDGSLYCFPFRDGFVAVTEHTGWASDLRIAFKDRAARPLAIEEVAGWKRGTWDPEAARLAWGLVRHLMDAQRGRPGQLSALLEEMRRVRDEQDRRPTGPHTWERNRDWSMPPATQDELLQKHFGKDVWKKATITLRGIKDAPAASPNDTQRSRRSAARG